MFIASVFRPHPHCCITVRQICLRLSSRLLTGISNKSARLVAAPAGKVSGFSGRSGPHDQESISPALEAIPPYRPTYLHLPLHEAVTGTLLLAFTNKSNGLGSKSAQATRAITTAEKTTVFLSGAPSLRKTLRGNTLNRRASDHLKGFQRVQCHQGPEALPSDGYRATHRCFLRYTRFIPWKRRLAHHGRDED